jgi:hypothetical protein
MVKFVVCIGKNYEKNASFRVVHFGLEIQENRQAQFSTTEISFAI